MATMYFLYSAEQISEKNKVLKASGKSFVPGTVVVNGKRLAYTQLSTTPTIKRFIDTKIIASGNITDFTYIAPSTEMKRGN